MMAVIRTKPFVLQYLCKHQVQGNMGFHKMFLVFFLSLGYGWKSSSPSSWHQWFQSHLRNCESRQIQQPRILRLTLSNNILIMNCKILSQPMLSPTSPKYSSRRYNQSRTTKSNQMVSQQDKYPSRIAVIFYTIVLLNCKDTSEPFDSTA